MTNFKQATKDLLDENRTRLAVVAGTASAIGFAYLYGKTKGSITVEVYLKAAEDVTKLASLTQ
jgi:hypothetical protein